MKAPTRAGGYAPIRDYAAIGDGRSLALVACDGAIDWLCLPAFDGLPVFSSLLDSRDGGYLVLRPEGSFTADRRYLPGTNVLETTFRAAEGVVRVTDALTIDTRGPVRWHELTRRVECPAGTVRLGWELAPRFGWDLARGRTRSSHGIPVVEHGDLSLAVLSFELGEPLIEEGSVRSHVTLGPGDRGILSMCAFVTSPLLFSGRDALELRLDETVDYWRRWSSGDPYNGPWRDAVLRSALALELLVYRPSGAMAAAGTAGLPERIGGERNWDYRFAWLRDTAFALEAMQRLGYRDQVHASLAYVLDVSRHTHPRLQAFYGLRGGSGHTELDAPGLEGYRGSRPVRVGNDAAEQRQLGNYADVLMAAWRYVEDGNALDEGSGMRLAELADFVTEIWTEPDASIWELGDYRQYTQGKLAAWLALDRAVRLAERGELPTEGIPRWRSVAAAARHYVEHDCWSVERGAYVRETGSTGLDASVLLAGREAIDFLPADDPRLVATIDAIRTELGRGPLIYRYSGMEDREGAFLACSFWLAEALARAGRLEQAEELMDGMVGLANDVGLYSEQIDPDSLDMLGNFPQALSHLALVNAAFVVRDAARSSRARRAASRSAYGPVGS